MSLIAHCENLLPRFVEKCLPVPFLPRGILTSEAFAVCAMADYLGVDTIIESGVYDGRSTMFWTLWFGVTQSIEVSPRQDLQGRIRGAVLRIGDAERILPNLIEPDMGPTCIFFDGPKGTKAMAIADKCFENPQVRFVGIHDMHRMRKGACNPDREATKTWGRQMWFTDVPWFRLIAGPLDADYVGRLDEGQNLRWFPGLYRDADGLVVRQLGSYGPTVGFATREKIAL